MGAGINGIFIWEYVKRVQKSIEIIALFDNNKRKQYDSCFKLKYRIERMPVEHLKI